MNNTLFHYEREWHEVYTLSTQPSWGRKTALYKKETCVLNISSSWVIGCHGEKTPVDRLTNRTKEIFVLEWSDKSKAYYLKVIKNFRSTFEVSGYLFLFFSLKIDTSDPDEAFHSRKISSLFFFPEII